MQTLPLDVVLFGEAMAMLIADDYLSFEAADHYTRASAMKPFR